MIPAFPNGSRTDQKTKTTERFISAGVDTTVMDKTYYDSNKWHELDGITRSEVLLVNEHLKPATITGGVEGDLVSVLRDLGLLYVPVVLSTRDATPSYFVTRDSPRLSMYQQIRTENVLPFHRVLGDCLGYPLCCISEYARGPPHRNSFDPFPLSRFHKELKGIVQSGEMYPTVFDARPPAFTPCSVRCNRSKEMLATYLRTLEEHDPHALDDLMAFNRLNTESLLLRQASL